MSAQNRLPNFFILGAGRCGTTSLAQHLRGHDQIFIPEIKEPSFFASSFQWVSDPGKYIDLYRDGHEALARGDASHVYLEDPKSPEILEAFFPDAKFVLMFRNPADRAVALYAMMLEHGYEVHRTFEKALAAEDRRFESSKFRKTCPQSFWNFMYYRSGLFGEQVARYLERWPRDRFYATTLYDYLAEPDVVVGEILKTSWELTRRSWAQSPEVRPAREHVRSPLSISSVDCYGRLSVARYRSLARPVVR